MLHDQSPTRGMTMFEILEMVQCLFAVEQPDVPRLRRRQSTNCPAQMNEVRLDGRIDRMHTDFTRETVRLPGVTRAARSHNIRPLVRSTTRQRHEMIARQ